MYARKLPRRLLAMTNDKFNSVRFVLNEGVMKLTVVTPEVGEYEEEIPVDYSEDGLEIAFNPDFVLDVLRQIDTEKTELLLKDAMSPCIVKPFGDDGELYINVVMPIRI